jgi:hypothetical protein
MQQRSPQSSPLDNLTYDVLTLIHEKAKGLEAFDKYIENSREDDELTGVLERTRDHDRECIAELKEHLSRLLEQSGTSRNGKNNTAEEDDDESGEDDSEDEDDEDDSEDEDSDEEE